MANRPPGELNNIIAPGDPRFVSLNILQPGAPNVASTALPGADPGTVIPPYPNQRIERRYNENGVEIVDGGRHKKRRTKHRKTKYRKHHATKSRKHRR